VARSGLKIILMGEERLLHLHFHCLMGWYTRVYMNQSDDSLEEKKLLVSGGYAFAKLTARTSNVC
jgi:hypothetical protein